MTDFELAIINSVKAVFLLDVPISYCYFHLGQSLYRLSVYICTNVFYTLISNHS